MRAKTVYENISFERGRDPKTTIGIGRKARIIEWFATYAPNAEYTIDDNLNIDVKGELDLRETQIRELPDNLYVKGSLDLQGTQITELPKSLKVGRTIYKDF